jgi:hypothetical protein
VNFTLGKSVLWNTQPKTNVNGKMEYYKKYMLYGVSPLTMELFPYNYRAPTTIPWKMNKPVTGLYILVRMSNVFSYILL